MKAKKKSLAPWLVAVVLGIALVSGAAKAATGFSWEVVMDKVADKIAAKIEDLGEMLGASGTRFDNGLSADSTSPVAGEVRGTTLTITGASTLTGTSTASITAKQQYFLDFTYGSATTSYVNSQYTGPTVVVDAVYLDQDAGSSAITVNSAWRAYISQASADNNTNATGTLFLTRTLASSSLQIAYGGSVPSSYYTTSSQASLLTTGINGVVTTTPIMLYNNNWVNATSTAITSSTGRLRLLVHSF